MNIYILNATINGKIFLEVLLKKIQIKGIITLDNNGKKKTNEYYDYTKYCEDNKLECIKVSSYYLNEEKDRKIIEKHDIDLILVASWQRLIPDWLIEKCTIGVIGAHGSHDGIEKGRGRSPQNWALIAGKNRFSLSIFWIMSGVDNGNIIDTIEFEYLPTDTILVSYIKVSLYKAKMIIDNIENGRIARKEGTPQNKEGLFLPKRIKEDGLIDWNRDAINISNMIRALTKPYPGAYTKINGKEYCIWSARPVVVENIFYSEFKNGTILSILDESILVKCGNNLLLIDEIDNIDNLKEGDIFESSNYRIQIENIINRHMESYGTPLSSLVYDELEST